MKTFFQYMQIFNTNIFLFNFFSMLENFQFKYFFHLNNFPIEKNFQCNQFFTKKEEVNNLE
jgi:hypothetical protein